MAENFDKVAIKLGKIMLTKDLGKVLFNEAAGYFETLDNPNSTYEEKHRASVLAEDLLSKTKDIPEFVSSINKGRK